MAPVIVSPSGKHRHVVSRRGVQRELDKLRCKAPESDYSGDVLEAGPGPLGAPRAGDDGQDEGAVEAVAKSGLPVCLMHMQNQPRDMQEDPVYGRVEEEIYKFNKN